MKHITLLAAMAVSIGASAQRAPLSSVPHNVRGVHFNAERTATDTLQGPSFNVPAPQFALYTPGVAGQYVVGTNQYDQAMAQKFESTGDIFVEELIMFFGVKSGTGTVHVRVYGLDGAGFNEADAAVNDAPGTILGTVDVAMSEIDTGTVALAPTFVTFTPSVQVTGNFAGGFDFSDLPTGSTLGMFSTTDGDNTAADWNWEKTVQGDWIAMGNAPQGWDLHADFAIFAVIDDGTAGINDLGTVNNMRMSFIGGNPANSSVIVAYEMLESADARMTVLDAKGAKMMDQQLGRTPAGEHQTTLDVSSYSNGTYYVTIYANGNPLTKKLVVQH
ncbi:MAG: T9SS type A sorting domain-containing protein [Flavobacteriales bacterium]